MAIQEWTTCDVCNPKGIVTDLRRGVFEGPRDAAIDAGWAYKTPFFEEDGHQYFSADRQDICPDCQE